MFRKDNDDVLRLRQKYQDSLEALEQRETQWRDLEERLYRSLSRLALTAYGSDPKVDGRLDELRKAIRVRCEAQELEGLIDQVHEAIGQVETEGTATAGHDEITRFLMRLLDDLPWPSPLLQPTQSLKRRLASSSDSDAVLAEATRLLEDLCTLALEGRRDASASNDECPGREGRHDGTEARGQLALGPVVTPNEVLLQLLERVEQSLEVHERAAAIKARLADPIGHHELPEVLDGIAEMVTDMRRLAHKQRVKMESFLRTITDRLQELESFLTRSSQDHSESVQDRDRLKDSMLVEMRGMQSDVQEASDLESLQRVINERLETIETHVTSYLEAEAARHLRADEEIQGLSERLRTLETEAGGLRESLQRQRQQALCDALTGVYNRMAFDERIMQEHARWKRYGNPTSVLFWDLDHFKKINDAYGHQAGDKVLKTVAQAMQRQIRSADFIARYGGEEFVILLPQTAIDAACQVAEKLRCAIEATPFHHGNTPVKVTISCGVAQFTDTDTPETVLQRADEALYWAKQQGRNRVGVEQRAPKSSSGS